MNQSSRSLLHISQISPVVISPQLKYNTDPNRAIESTMTAQSLHTPVEYSPREYSAKEYVPREYPPKEYLPREYSPKEHSLKDTNSVVESDDSSEEWEGDSDFGWQTPSISDDEDDESSNGRYQGRLMKLLNSASGMTKRAVRYVEKQYVPTKTFEGHLSSHDTNCVVA
ncbi:hypothetical protein PC116_g30147 [Phytophthora cactorum]|nr:hypothetical protein PC116_g30147 [Phytophthora cactorum]